MFSLKASTVLGLGGGMVSSSASVSSSEHSLGASDAGVVSVLDLEQRLVAASQSQVSAEERAALVCPSVELSIARVPRLHVPALVHQALASSSLAPASPPSASSSPSSDASFRSGFVISALSRAASDLVALSPLSTSSPALSGRILPSPSLPYSDSLFAPASGPGDAKSAASALDEAVLAPLQKKSKKKQSKLQHHQHQPSLFCASPLPALPSDPRPIMDLPRSTAVLGAVQALVHVKQIRATGMTGKLLEPLFLSMCLFNVRKRERITETIHVFENLNPPEVVLSMGDRVSHMVHELKAQRALFPLEDLSPDVFLVFVLEKTLRGADVDESLDELIRQQATHSSSNSKAGKSQDEVRMSTKRLGGYRMPLAWAARCLFEKGRSIIGTDIVVDQFVRFSSRNGINDSQIIAQLEKVAERNLKTSSTSASGSGSIGGVGIGGVGSGVGTERQVPFQVVIDFDLVGSDKVLPHLVSPSLELLSSSMSVASNPGDLIRVVQNFYGADSAPVPIREPCNDLFLFFDWANFSKAQRRIKTISVRVTLHDNDESLGQQGLAVFYGRFAGKFDKECTTSVQYHERRLSM